MRCPRCVQKIHRGAETCPRCGFALSCADAAFDQHPQLLPALADRAGWLRLAERRRVQKAMDRFSTRFPDVFFAVYTGIFRDHESLRIAAFWLLNRVRFDNPDDIPNNSAVLLVIDVERKAATMSYGYHLEPYLNEEDTFTCLSKAHQPWLEARYDAGIVALIAALEKILMRKSRQAPRTCGSNPSWHVPGQDAGEDNHHNDGGEGTL